jgi:hypothetical protein
VLRNGHCRKRAAGWRPDLTSRSYLIRLQLNSGVIERTRFSRGMLFGRYTGMAAPFGFTLLKREALGPGQLNDTMAHQEAHHVLGVSSSGVAPHQEVATLVTRAQILTSNSAWDRARRKHGPQP